jgi:hypothetical protein
MPSCIRPLTSLVILLLLAPRLRAGTPGGEPPVRVVLQNDIRLAPNLSATSTRLSAALADALKQRGYEPIASAPSTCSETPCLHAMATTNEAKDVLIVTGGPNNLYGYDIDVRLWSAPSDRDERASARCNTCNAAQMVDNVLATVGTLLDRIPALNVVAQVPPVAAAVPAAQPTVMAPPGPPSPPRRLSPVKVGFGIGLLAAGGVGLGVGAFELASNGKSLSCGNGVCSQVYRTNTTGALLIAGGALLAAGGATLLIFFRDDSSATSIAIGTSGISMGGTF